MPESFGQTLDREGRVGIHPAVTFSVGAASRREHLLMFFELRHQTEQRFLFVLDRLLEQIGVLVRAEDSGRKSR